MQQVRNRKLSDGFKAAWEGFRETLIFERVFRVMLIIALIVVGAMLYFPTSRLEKVVLLAAVFAVLVLELLNSVVERVMDFLSPEYNEQARLVKDLMAAIVLLASIGVAVIGIIIFFPYIINR